MLVLVESHMEHYTKFLMQLLCFQRIDKVITSFAEDFWAVHI